MAINSLAMTNQQLVENLENIYKLLEHGFCQGTLAQTILGEDLESPLDLNASNYCLLGATHRTFNTDDPDDPDIIRIAHIFIKSIQELYPDFARIHQTEFDCAENHFDGDGLIPKFNDYQDRERVLNLVKYCIEKYKNAN